MRFDLKNLTEVWIQRIHDPFLDFSKKTQNPFLDSRIRIRIFQKKKHAALDDKKYTELNLTYVGSKNIFVQHFTTDSLPSYVPHLQSYVDIACNKY